MKTEIGKKVYPIDNSYCESLTGGADKRLAGTLIGHEPKLCTIISDPYKGLVDNFGKQKEYEFINVFYDGHVYKILNAYENENKERFSNIQSDSSVFNDVKERALPIIENQRKTLLGKELSTTEFWKRNNQYQNLKRLVSILDEAEEIVNNYLK